MSMELLSKLNDMTSRRSDISWISRNKEWPKTPRALSDRLNEVIPNLRDIGIIIHRDYDKHRKSDTIIITNNNHQATEFLDSDKLGDQTITDGNVTQDNQK
jgi:hypothetical protein